LINLYYLLFLKYFIYLIIDVKKRIVEKSIVNFTYHIIWSLENSSIQPIALLGTFDQVSNTIIIATIENTIKNICLK
jgi:hypothetical protein